MKKLRLLFNDPLNWMPFLALAIFLRGIVWLFLGHMVHANMPVDETIAKYFVRDDYVYFFTPVDNFFRTGHYTYLNGIPFTGRMPGYSLVYFMYMMFFNANVSLHLVICTQFLLSAISVYVLALISYYIFNNKNCFYISFLIYVLAVYPGFFDFFVIAESLSVSSIIFCFYYLVKYVYVAPKNKYLVLSGLFLTWTIFMREYTGTLIILFPLAIGCFIFFVKKESFTKTVGSLILFCLPFVVCDAAWATRNYIETKKNNTDNHTRTGSIR